MNLAAEILVIILSVTLTIFLIVGIIMMVYLVKLTRQIRKVTMSAERTVDGIESVVSRIVKMSSPIFAAEMIAKLFRKFKKHKEEK